MDKSSVIYNIRGCIGYADFEGAMNWIYRASSAFDTAQFIVICDSVLADLRERKAENLAIRNLALSIIDFLQKLEPENDGSRRRHFDEQLDAELRKQEEQKRLEELRVQEQRVEEMRQQREREGVERTRREAEERERRKRELERLERQKHEAQLLSAKKFLKWAGHYSDGLSVEQMLRKSETLAPRVLSREQHRQGIRKLGLSMDDDHFLTNSYRRLYRRVTHCYRCPNRLDNSLDKECEHCGWIVCDCGACGCGYEGN